MKNELNQNMPVAAITLALLALALPCFACEGHKEQILAKLAQNNHTKVNNATRQVHSADTTKSETATNENAEQGAETGKAPEDTGKPPVSNQ